MGQSDKMDMHRVLNDGVMKLAQTATSAAIRATEVN